MIPRPTVTTGDRRIVTGCIFVLFPIILILVLVLLLQSALKSCSHTQAEPPAEQPAPDAPTTPPAPLEPPEPPDPPVPEFPVVPEVPPLPPAPPSADLPDPAEPADPASPTPAPHLRHVRWGMTPDEVRAAEAPAVPLRDKPSALLYSTTTLDLPCHLTYTFRAGRLAAARLQFSRPNGGDVPALSPVAAHAAYLWLRSQLTARYGAPASENHATRPRPTTHLADRAARSREDAEAYAATLATARRRLADRTAQLREKYRNWPEAAARIDRELASERRYVADLEAWIADTQAAERTALATIEQSRRDDLQAPLPARDTATWSTPLSRTPGHTVTLTADYTTTPSRLEIRYETTLLLSDEL